MRLFKLLSITSCCLLASCGTYIPSQRDWPKDTPGGVNDMNSVLARSIVCELSYAVTTAIRNDRSLALKRSSRRAYSDFLKEWGVEVATDLLVTENSSVSPSGLWAPVSPLTTIFTLGGGVSGGAVSTNDNKYNVFYPLWALYQPKLFPVDSEVRPCRDPSGNKEGSPLVDIDLRVLPLLESRMQIVALGLADDPGKKVLIEGEKNVLTQTVSIKEFVAGDITPTWTFTTGAINPTGRFISAGRERTHQVVFTFGQLAAGGRSLSFLAEQTHLNEQLKAGLRNSRFAP